MSDERIFLSLLILLFFGWFSLFPTLTQTYMTQTIKKGSCSPERVSLQAIWRALYLPNKIWVYIKDVWRDHVAWKK